VLKVFPYFANIAVVICIYPEKPSAQAAVEH
jgi:hypothetical protein